MTIGTMIGLNQDGTPYQEVGPHDSRQIGSFSVPIDLINQHPKRVSAIFALMECVVVQAEARHGQGVIEYVALSPLFAPVNFVSAPPRYALLVEDGADGNPVNVTAEPIPHA